MGFHPAPHTDRPPQATDRPAHADPGGYHSVHTRAAGRGPGAHKGLPPVPLLPVAALPSQKWCARLLGLAFVPQGFGACPRRCAPRRRLRPGGRARPSGPLSCGLRPRRALAARPRLRGLAVRLSGGAAVVGGLSPAPPRPAAPAWGSGEREARCARGLRAPAGGLLFAALSRRHPRGIGAPGAPIRRRLTVRKLSTRPTRIVCAPHFSLDFRRGSCYIRVARLACRPFGGHS